MCNSRGRRPWLALAASRCTVPLPWSWGGAGEFVLKTAVVVGRAFETFAFPDSRIGGIADGEQTKASRVPERKSAWNCVSEAVYARVVAVLRRLRFKIRSGIGYSYNRPRCKSAIGAAHRQRLSPGGRAAHPTRVALPVPGGLCRSPVPAGQCRLPSPESSLNNPAISVLIAAIASSNVAQGRVPSK